jgi:hypothetical protein
MRGRNKSYSIVTLYVYAVVIVLLNKHITYFNNWVMHPVARVSIKYWKTSVRNTVFFSARFYCVRSAQ